MVVPRHLNNAPITEAVIEFRVKLSTPLDLKQGPDLPANLKPRYPIVKPVHRTVFQFGIEAGEPVTVPPREGLWARRFESADGKQVVLFRHDGFAFSRLKPYTDWSTVLSEAKELWSVYGKMATVEHVTRVGVRNINHIDLPLPIDDLEQYLTVPPKTPEGAVNDIISFMTMVVVHDASRQLDARITQAMERGASPDRAVIILDIDAYKSRDTGFAADEIWAVLEQLRELKNQVFFGSITEDTVRLFQ